MADLQLLLTLFLAAKWAIGAMVALIIIAIVVAARSLLFGDDSAPATSHADKAQTAVVLRAGSAALDGDALGRLLQFCHARTQAKLTCVSRGMRDAVHAELPAPWMDSEHELETLAYIGKREPSQLLTASALDFSHGAYGPISLAADEGKGIGVLLRYSENLGELRLTNNQLGDRGATYMAQALPRNTSLTILRLDSNELGDDAAVAIAAALQHNRTLECLSLSENGVGAEVHFRHPGESEGIGDVGATALAESLRHNRTLKTLLLASNELTDNGARALLATLRENDTLTCLDLRCNHLESDEVEAELLRFGRERPMVMLCGQ